MASNGGFELQKTVNANGAEVQAKPTRAELLERLKMAKMRGSIQRMSKKQREAKVEELKSKFDEQQKIVMESLKSQMTPEQLAQMGIPSDANVQFETLNGSLNEANKTVVDAPDISTATEENPIHIPITIPKMSSVAQSE